MRRPAAGSQQRLPLHVSLIDFGPSTAAEAERYGFVGADLAFDTGDHGVVISRDPKFDARSDACDSWIYHDVSPGLVKLQTRAARLQDSAEAQYVSKLTREVTTGVARRVRCVRAIGYPQLTVEKFMAADQMEDVLRAAGVEAGTRRDPTGHIPTEAQVRPGRVRVFPPRPAAEYVPSRGEIRLASAYVECGRRTGFARLVHAASARARHAVEARLGGRAKRLGRQLEHAAQRLRRGNDGEA